MADDCLAQVHFMTSTRTHGRFLTTEIDKSSWSGHFFFPRSHGIEVMDKTATQMMVNSKLAVLHRLFG